MGRHGTSDYDAPGREPHDPFVNPDGGIVEQPDQRKFPVTTKAAEKGEWAFDWVRILGEDTRSEPEENNGHARNEASQHARHTPVRSEQHRSDEGDCAA